MKYTKNYQYKNPNSDDAYDIQNDFILWALSC